jgi:hypothetical protein
MSKHSFLAICRWAAALAAAFAALPAHASFLSGEALDKAADIIAIVVLIVVPVVVIVVFWLLHVMPERLAEKRHHPQAAAIQTLCLLSLVFGGLLWPLAWLWAFTKPVGYKVAYGTDKHEHWHETMGEKARAGELPHDEVAHPAQRARRDGREGRAAVQPEEASHRPRAAGSGRGSADGGRGSSLMDILLLGIYSLCVWLIFIKFKWLPWNIYSQVTVVIIPIVALTVMILTLNVVAPSSSDVRVFRYTVPIVSQVRGRVIEVPIEEGNRPVKKGDVLFRIDPTPYQLQVNTLQAQLASASAQQRELEESVKGAQGKIVETRGAIAQAQAKTAEVTASLDLARKRVTQYRELVASGAGTRFDLERAETNVVELTGQLNAAPQRRSAGAVRRDAGHLFARAGAAEAGRAIERGIRTDRANPRPARKREMGSRSDNDAVPLRLLRDQPAAEAGWIRGRPPGGAGDDTGRGDRQRHRPLQPERVAPGGTRQRGRVRAEHVPWARHQRPGQLDRLGAGCRAGAGGRNAADDRRAHRAGAALRRQVRRRDKDKDLFLAAGAAGDAAIYTDHAAALHILRKVILRVGSYTNYLILKLH